MANYGKAYIEVEGLLISACHGVGTEERVVPQDFRLDICLGYDAVRAMYDDNIFIALDYAEVVEIAKRVMAEPSMLLENVVGRLRKELVQTMPQISSGRIRLAKLNPPIDAKLTSCAFVLEW